MSYYSSDDPDGNNTDYEMARDERHTDWRSWLNEDEDMVTCPACDGRGMDRWEIDECSECWGEGVVPRA